MFKNLIFLTIAGVVGFLAGLSYANQFKGSVSVNENQVSTERTNRVIIAETRTVKGRVVEVSGKEMTLESEGDRLTIKAGDSVLISRPESPGEASPAATENVKDDSVVVGQHRPAEIEPQTDFASIKIGEVVMATLERNQGGEFLVKSVGVLKE